MKLIIETELSKYRIEISRIPKEEAKEECLGVNIIVDDQESYSGVLVKDMQGPVHL